MGLVGRTSWEVMGYVPPWCHRMGLAVPVSSNHWLCYPVVALDGLSALPSDVAEVK